MPDLHPGQAARHDPNYIPGVITTDFTDTTKSVAIKGDPATGRMLVNVTGTTNPTPPSTPVVTAVGDSITSGTLVAANTSRKEVEFYNGSSAILYLLKGTGTASASNYTVQLNQGDYYGSDITSAFVGIWASATGGKVYITEST